METLKKELGQDAIMVLDEFDGITSREQFLRDIEFDYTREFRESAYGYWEDQYDLYACGYRGLNLHDITLVTLNKVEG